LKKKKTSSNSHLIIGLGSAVPALHDFTDLFYILLGVQAPITPVSADIGDQSILFPTEKRGF
jgi:hypothetical protein